MTSSFLTVLQFYFSTLVLEFGDFTAAFTRQIKRFPCKDSENLSTGVTHLYPVVSGTPLFFQMMCGLGLPPI